MPAPDETPGRSDGHRLPLGRALSLLALFALAVVLLLGTVHPTEATTTATAAKVTSPEAKPKSAPPKETTTTTTIPANRSNVQVLVANAAGVAGAAAAVRNQLQVQGWNMQAPTNATAQLTTSQVLYVAGQRANALTIASELKLPPTTVGPYTTSAPIATGSSADVIVLVAPDLATHAG